MSAVALSGKVRAFFHESVDVGSGGADRSTDLSLFVVARPMFQLYVD